jgi:hypothetical protein
MSTVRVLIVRPDGEAEVRRIEATLDAWIEVVGGYLQVVTIAGIPGAFYCDEEGRLKGLQPNIAASVFVRALGCTVGPLVGPVVFFGVRGDRESDVPQELVDEFHAMRARMEDDNT